MASSFHHVPVMCGQILDLFEPGLAGPDPLMLDTTLGLGGHSLAALTRFESLRLIGIDRDPQALSIAEDRLSPFAGRVELHQTTYDHLDEALNGRRPAAILFDLGLSSMQIDSTERGFSYAWDSELSMRMDGDDDQLTAADVVNTYTVGDLASIFRRLGDEPHALRIASAIVARRDREPFTSSSDLVATIIEATPTVQRRSGHPAKRVFQALRMEVNHERESLQSALPKALRALALGGRLAVLSYHSGEDRIVKRLFQEAVTDRVPSGLAIVPDQYQAQFRLVVRSGLQPSPTEMNDNPRSRSARLRVIQRIKEK
ncbi:MAG: 16S rRNA (cytosine(1402)-N(4))-methyltransferase RsmH [Propionibacteriaceae bacterium]|jgi:16S rRNA (cytosine1402-N4)-methyltransferase|nr:16S rRNA (cytosine(1402)-N(4))-methyltransferase RsmH [Propionibacteriaceae bacterium]